MSLEDIPTQLATTWGISLGAAQVILSVVVILLVILPVLYLTRDKGVLIPSVMFILVEAVLVAITWLPSWLMIVTVVVIALMWAKMGSDIVGG